MQAKKIVLLVGSGIVFGLFLLTVDIREPTLTDITTQMAYPITHTEPDQK